VQKRNHRKFHGKRRVFSRLLLEMKGLRNGGASEKMHTEKKRRGSIQKKAAPSGGSAWKKHLENPEKSWRCDNSRREGEDEGKNGMLGSGWGRKRKWETESGRTTEL